MKGEFPIEDTPTARLIRQVLGAVAEFDKAMTLAKLRGARERKPQTTKSRTVAIKYDRPVGLLDHGRNPFAFRRSSQLGPTLCVMKVITRPQKPLCRTELTRNAHGEA